MAKVENVVQMKDGREVNFGARGKLKKQIEIAGEGTDRTVSISVDCANGDTHTMTFDLNDALFFEYAAHGVSQKITDSVTKADDPEDISAGVQNQINQLKSGVWTTRSSDGTIRGFSDLVEALRRIKQYEDGSAEHQQLRQTLLAKSEEELKLFKANNAVKAILAEIASEKAAARAAKLVAGGSSDIGDLDGLM